MSSCLISPWAWLLAGLFVVLMSCSCSTITPLRYAVVVVNDGATPICVAPFEVADDPDSVVGVGRLLPGISKGMHPYYSRPHREVVIVWRLLNTDQAGQARAIVELPKEFDRDRGAAIIFRIKPELGVIATSYEYR